MPAASAGARRRRSRTGAASSAAISARSPAIVELVIERYLAPAVIGVDARQHRRTARAHGRASIKGYPYAKAAVEFAAYDLAGRALGVPVAYAARRRARATHAGDAFDRPDRDRGGREARPRRSRPRASGPSRSRSASIPSATSRWCGASAPRSGRTSTLCVDANEGYKTPGEAIKTIRRDGEVRLKYAEQPVHGHRAHRRGRARDRHAGDGRRERMERARRDRRSSSSAPRRSCRSTPPSRAGSIARWRSRRCARAAGHRLQRQRLGRDRHRQSRQPAAGGRRAGGRRSPASCRCRRRPKRSSGQIGGIYYKDDLIGEPMALVDGAIERADGARHGHRCRRSQDRDNTASRIEADMRKEIVDAPGQGDAGERARRLIVLSRRRTSPTSPDSWCPSQPLIRHRHAMVVVTADGSTAIFGVDMEATTIRGASPATPSRIWAEFTDSAMAVLADQLDRASGWRRRGSASRWTTCRPATSRALQTRAAAGALQRQRSAFSRGCARSRPPDEIDAAAPAVAHRRPGDHRRARRGEGGRHRDGHRRRT